MNERVTTIAESYYPPLNAWFEARAYPSTAALRGEPYDIEHRIIAGGTVKWVRERAELEFDPQGGLKGGFGTTQDITALKKTEAKLKQSEEALRQSNDQLEAMVRKRTVELEDTVATLKIEIAARKKIQAQLYQLSRKSLEALEAGRRAVARELHDSIGGSLAAIKFGMEGVAERVQRCTTCGAPSMEALISNLADTIKETKRISANLRPLAIDDLGLLATIEWYTRQFCQRYEHIRVVRQIDILEQEIPEEFKIVFYRVMQEALTNAARHSRADTVTVRLLKGASHFEFEVEDNGCGFDTSNVFDAPDRLSGFGLKGMKERAEICGGFFNLRTWPGAGTSVKVILPLAAASVFNPNELGCAKSDIVSE